MFRNSIDLLPPFSGNIMDKLYKGYTNDKSLFMTMETLLFKRQPDMKIRCMVYETPDADSFKAVESIDPEEITFFWYATDQEPESVLPVLDYEKLEHHEAFLTDKLDQKIYIRLLKNTAIIFCKRFTMQLFHASQAFIAKYFPDIFADKPLTEDEKKLLTATAAPTDSDYKKAIQKALTKDAFRKYLLRSSIIGLERGMREKRYDAAVREVERFREKMEQAMQNYRSACESMNQANITASGLRMSMEEVGDHTEFEEYLCENKNLSDIRIDDRRIQFVVKTFLHPYNFDDWDAYSRRGAIFTGHSKTGSVLDDPENLKLLLDAIFSSDHTLKLKMCANFRLDYYGTDVDSIIGYDFTQADPDMKCYIPNTHLNRHSCFGDNKPDILDCLERGDLISAVECCISCAKRQNICENITFSPLIDSIMQNKYKCIVTEDGREMTTKEAVEYLKGKMTDEEKADGDGEVGAA